MVNKSCGSSSSLSSEEQLLSPPQGVSWFPLRSKECCILQLLPKLEIKSATIPLEGFQQVWIRKEKVSLKLKASSVEVVSRKLLMCAYLSVYSLQITFFL